MLVFLWPALVSFIVSQAFFYPANHTICVGLRSVLDGVFFSTIFVFIAVVLLELYFEASSRDGEVDFEVEACDEL